MNYPRFENSRHFLEYALLFLYDQLIYRSLTEVSLSEYSNFKLTEPCVFRYNSWLSAGKENKEIIENWLRAHRTEALDFKQRWDQDFHPKPVLWSDRKKTVYFSQQLEEAFLFENHIARLLKDQFNLEIGAFMDAQGQYDLGENALGIEIKNDKLLHKTGNLYIEYQEKADASNSKYVNSGILKQDNTRFFLIGTADQFYILRKSHLLYLYHQAINGRQTDKIRLVKTATSKGMLLPLKHFEKVCISLNQMVADLQA
jgi:hypothetical protein